MIGTLADYLVAQERLPYEEGWSKSTEEITAAQVLALVNELVAAT